MTYAAAVVALVVASTTAHADAVEVATIAPGHADVVEIAAIAPGHADVREAFVVGPGGQVFEPDGHGAWSRRHEGGVAATIVTATRAGTAVIAGTAGGPPFKLIAGVWTSLLLGPHAKAIVGNGSRAVAAVGKTVFALDRGPPTRLPDAPAAVIALAASATGVVIETERGVLRLEGKTWKPATNAPHHVASLLDDHWALVEHGIVELRTGRITQTPTSLRIAAATSIGDDVLAAGTRGGAAVLLTLHAGALTEDPIAFDHAAPIVAVVGDRQGRVLVATRDGQLAVRDGHAWTTAQLRDELPAPRAGSPPARSR